MFTYPIYSYTYEVNPYYTFYYFNVDFKMVSVLEFEK